MRNHPKCEGSGKPAPGKRKLCQYCLRQIACVGGRLVEHWWTSPKRTRTEEPQQ